MAVKSLLKNKLGLHFIRLENLVYQNNPFIVYTIGQSSTQHTTLNQLNITKQIFLNIYYFPSTLVLLKYKDPFIKYATFESYLTCSFPVWAQNFSTIKWIVNFNNPYSSKICLRITSLQLLFKYWSGWAKCCRNYVSIN